jgi:hypothetical protein
LFVLHHFHKVSPRIHIPILTVRRRNNIHLHLQYCLLTHFLRPLHYFLPHIRIRLSHFFCCFLFFLNKRYRFFNFYFLKSTIFRFFQRIYFILFLFFCYRFLCDIFIRLSY